MDQMETLQVDITRCQPPEPEGGSYISLPKAVKDKKTVTNVKNKVENCLRWDSGMAPRATAHHVTNSKSVEASVKLQPR